ncbi:ABC transporter permease [Streptomyces sp. NPDC005070]
MPEAPAVPLPASAERVRPGSLDLLVTPPRARTGWRLLPARVAAMCAVELQKLRHDRTELYTRAIQPALWLLIFGETFTRIHAIPTGGIPYLDYLAPGIIAQSAMFIAIFYGIMIIWERDAGILTKLLVTPTPRSALITGKAFAAGVKALIQAVVVVVIAALLGVAMTWNPLRLFGVAVAVVLGSAFFSCLSMTIAGIVLTRDRLMGIGHVMAVPLQVAAEWLTSGYGVGGAGFCRRWVVCLRRSVCLLCAEREGRSCRYGALVRIMTDRVTPLAATPRCSVIHKA